MIIVLSILILILSIVILIAIIIDSICYIKENKKLPFSNYLIFGLDILNIYMYTDFLIAVYRGVI